MEHAYVNDYSDAGLGIQKRNVQPIVEFFKQAVEDEAKTAQTGSPQFREVECIRIIIPGDLRNIVERRVEEPDKRNYLAAWKAYQTQEQMAIDGTPLEMWPLLGKVNVRVLKAHHIFTVQQLAALDDTKLSDLGILGTRTLRRQAQEFLRVAETGKVSSQIVGEVEALKKQNEMLVEQLRQANVKFEEMLRKQGSDLSRHDSYSVPAAAPVAAAPSAAPTNPIPENWKSLSDKDLFALVDKVVGVKVNKRSAAVEAIEDALAG